MPHSRYIDHVLSLLEETRFPKCRSRCNISSEPITAFVLGDVNYRGQRSLGGRTRGPSRYNRRFPELWQAIQDMISHHRPNFSYTTVQVNKNVVSPPHVDKNNVGPSYIIALGDFEGGQLVIEGREHDIQHRFKKFDGTKGHWITPFKGTRYSLVFFTHTFKPPHSSLRGLEVTRDGLFQNGECIRRYPHPRL